jgi:hypothetical protein
MKFLMRSLIIYFELFLLAGNFFIPAVSHLDYARSDSRKDIPIISQGNFLQDLIAIKDNHDTFQKRVQNCKSNDLFIFNHPLTVLYLDFFVIKKSKALIAYRTPEYLLSSDLKSPPNYL